MKLLAAAITWLAIMAAGGFILWLAMVSIGFTGAAVPFIAIGWGVIGAAVATIAAIAIYETVE